MGHHGLSATGCPSNSLPTSGITRLVEVETRAAILSNVVPGGPWDFSKADFDLAAIGAVASGGMIRNGFVRLALNFVRALAAHTTLTLTHPRRHRPVPDDHPRRRPVACCSPVESHGGFHKCPASLGWDKTGAAVGLPFTTTDAATGGFGVFSVFGLPQVPTVWCEISFLWSAKDPGDRFDFGWVLPETGPAVRRRDPPRGTDERIRSAGPPDRGFAAPCHGTLAGRDRGGKRRARRGKD